jgi:hypothetical protein
MRDARATSEVRGSNRGEKARIVGGTMHRGAHGNTEFLAPRGVRNKMKGFESSCPDLDGRLGWRRRRILPVNFPNSNFDTRVKSLSPSKARCGAL